MKYRDSTDPATRRLLVPILTDQDGLRQLERAARIHFHIAGVYHSIVGPEWSSRGKAQTDFFHYIHLACSGGARIRHRGVSIELRQGQAYWLPGNTPVVRDPAERYEAYVVKFRCETTAGADLLLDWPGRGPRPLGAWDRELWEARWRSGPPGTDACLALQGLLRGWLALAYPELDEIITVHQETFTRFTRALRVIETRLGAGLRVSDLARAHGTSPAAFSMAFERHVGLSPKAYLNRRLSQEACALLLNTDRRVKEIARQLGFVDEFYFSRFFRKMNGASPDHFRRLAGPSNTAEVK